MKFSYREYVAPLSGSSDFRLILRPVIQISVVGGDFEATCAALVDSGADETIFPLSIARAIGVSLLPELQGKFKGVSGDELVLHFGEVELNVSDENQTVRWKTIVGFADFKDEGDELAILGHGGFLDYFTAIFDGKEAQVELIPNDLIPATLIPAA